MSLPAKKTETTDPTTTDEQVTLSAELLLSLRAEEAGTVVFNGNAGVATLQRWVVILDQVRHGYPLTVAAAEAGVAYRTVKYWLERGRNAEYPYDCLVEAIEMAKASAEKAHLDNIFYNAFVKQNWLPSAWYLERTNPERYSRRQHVKEDDRRPKEFTLIIDGSGKIADRIEERVEESKAIPVESRVSDD